MVTVPGAMKVMKAKNAKKAMKTKTKKPAMKSPGLKKQSNMQKGIRIPGFASVQKAVQFKDAPKSLGKIRIGIVHGKVFDPVKVGAQDRDYPEKFKIKNNTGPNAPGWGGAFQADVNTGLKIARIAPDIFEIDFMKVDEVTEARAAKNHMNWNLWGCMSVAMMEKGKVVSDRLQKVQTNINCRHMPQWQDYEFITYKTMYMKGLAAAGVPVIDSIICENGFKANDVLKKIQAKGWDKFLVKPAYMSFFGQGILHGNTADLKKDITPFREYEKEHKKEKYFLVQPYMLKPNGEVFDEIRNFIINGEWSYSVFTHGTDDNAVYEQPAGALKDKARELAMTAYEVLKKVTKYEGVPVHSLLTRVDVGVMPDPTIKGGWRIFVNEFEPHLATWLGRYCPFELTDKMAHAIVTQTRQLLRLSLRKKRKIPDAAKVETLLQILDGRLGPAPSIFQ